MGAPAHVVPAGWYEDPHDLQLHRWWDGTAWCENRIPREAPIAAPATRTKQQVTRRSECELFTAGVGPYEQVTTTRRDVFRSFTSSFWYLQIALLITMVFMVLIGVDQLLSADDASGAKFAVMIVSIGLLVPWLPYMYLSAQIKDRDRERWRTTRGFTLGRLPITPLEQMLPIFQLGTRRTLAHVMEGQLVDAPAALACYTYMYDERDLDELFTPKRAQLSGRWGIVCMTLPEPVAQRYAGISVMPRRGGWIVEDDATELSTESQQLERVVRIQLAPGQDPIAARELLGPQLLDALAASPMYWEQRGNQLLVLLPGSDSTEVGAQLMSAALSGRTAGRRARSSGTADLLTDARRDALCQSAAFLFEHYLTEDR